MSGRERRLAGNKNTGDHYSLPSLLNMAQIAKNLKVLKNPQLPVQET